MAGFAAAGGFGSFGRLNYGGSRSCLSSWTAPQDEGESGGGVGWTGEGLVATKRTGGRQWPSWPETGKTASPGRLRARGVLVEWLEAA